MDGLTPKEKVTLADEISQLLKPLLDALGVIITAIPHYKVETWYQALETHFHLLPTLPPNIKSQEDLAECEELRSFRKEGIPFSKTLESMMPAESETVQLLLANFNDLENCQNRIVILTLKLPSPSNYCIGPTYRCCQHNPKQAVCDGHVGMAIPMELLHLCFRTFTYWSFLEPYPFPRPHWDMSRQIDKSAFICVYQTVYQLLFSMPVFYTAHYDCVEEFEKGPSNDFPRQWYFSMVCKCASWPGPFWTYWS